MYTTVVHIQQPDIYNSCIYTIARCTTAGHIQQPDIYNRPMYITAVHIQQPDIYNSCTYTTAGHIQQPDVYNSQTYTIALNLFMVRATAIGTGDKIRGQAISKTPTVDVGIRVQHESDAQQQNGLA